MVTASEYPEYLDPQKAMDRLLPFFKSTKLHTCWTGAKAEALATKRVRRVDRIMVIFLFENALG
jgi:hypothetical protein